MAVPSSPFQTPLNGVVRNELNGHLDYLTKPVCNSVVNGVHSVNKPVHAEMNGAEYKIRETPMGTKRSLKIAFMGFGCSGINFAYQLEARMQYVELTIYEKNNDLGGTWLENKYPGCACDIPSVCYQYSWQRKPDWSSYYSGSREIYEYFKSVASSNNLQRYVKFSHKVVKAEWLEEQGKWKLTIMKNNDPADTFEDYADFFLNGGGFLNTWKWPEIKGLDSFRGHKLHTANWDDNVDLINKKVLVVGAGSSGVQVVPTIIDRVDQLHVVARSPTWITAGFAPKYAGPNGENFAYSEETKQLFREDPKFYLTYCKAVESELNLRFRLVVNDSPEAVEARTYSIKEMKRKLAKKPELIEKLMPRDFGVGCRRPTPGNGFLEALTHNKTTVITDNLQEITSTGYVGPDGVYHDVDIIICATGFDTSFCPQFPIYANGRNIQNDFRTSETVGYLGFNMPEIPNYFIFCGPYGPLGHGSVVPMVEAYTNYMLQVLEKVQVEDIKKIQVKQSAAEQFTKHADLYVQRTAWSGPCSSWFKGGVKNRKPVIWPGSRIHYLTMLQQPRFEDYEIEYISGNAFNFLGDGFDVREYDGTDITWYYGLVDGQDKQPTKFPPPLH